MNFRLRVGYSTDLLADQIGRLVAGGFAISIIRVIIKGLAPLDCFE